jgi:hypothetical protein
LLCLGLFCFFVLVVVEDADDPMARIKGQIDHAPPVMLPNANKVCAVWSCRRTERNANNLTGGRQIHPNLQLREIIRVNSMSSAIVPTEYAE